MKNSKLNLTLGVICVAVLSGCASVPAPEPYRDVEPALVGLPMHERIATSSTRINSQFELLNKVQAGEFAGKYDMLVHNQELDARLNSKKTLPQAYANKDVIAAKERADAEAEKSRLHAKALLATQKGQVIKRVDWQNSSLNELVKNFATAIDYNVIYVSKGKDANINFHAENESWEKTVSRLSKEVNAIALITVDDNVKSIFLNYN